MAFGIGPIPINAILSYLDLLEIGDISDRIWWFRLLRAIDVEYLQIHFEEDKKKTKKP